MNCNTQHYFERLRKEITLYEDGIKIKSLRDGVDELQNLLKAINYPFTTKISIYSNEREHIQIVYDHCDRLFWIKYGDNPAIKIQDSIYGIDMLIENKEAVVRQLLTKLSQINEHMEFKK